MDAVVPHPTGRQILNDAGLAAYDETAIDEDLRRGGITMRGVLITPVAVGCGCHGGGRPAAGWAGPDQTRPDHPPGRRSAVLPRPRRRLRGHEILLADEEHGQHATHQRENTADQQDVV